MTGSRANASAGRRGRNGAARSRAHEAPPDIASDLAAVSLSHAPKTLADRLRMQLSDEIVRGDLAPGVALDETELARRFGVSRTPVREAIRLLAASGLVDARPHRSAVVARPTPQQIIGMFEALRELETLCARFAAERMTAAERTQLQRIHRSLRPAVRSGDAQRYHELNEGFHDTIYAIPRRKPLVPL